MHMTLEVLAKTAGARFRAVTKKPPVRVAKTLDKKADPGGQGCRAISMREGVGGHGVGKTNARILA